jgi:hypothetical protein
LSGLFTINGRLSASSKDDPQPPGGVLSPPPPIYRHGLSQNHYSTLANTEYKNSVSGNILFFPLPDKKRDFAGQNIYNAAFNTSLPKNPAYEGKKLPGKHYTFTFFTVYSQYLV